MLVPAGTLVLHRDCCTVDIDLVHSRVRGRVSGTGAPLNSVTPRDFGCVREQQDHRSDQRTNPAPPALTSPQ